MKDKNILAQAVGMAGFIQVILSLCVKDSADPWMKYISSPEIYFAFEEMADWF